MERAIALKDYHPHNALEYLISVMNTPGTNLVGFGITSKSLSAKVRVFHASFATHGIFCVSG